LYGICAFNTPENYKQAEVRITEGLSETLADYKFVLSKLLNRYRSLDGRINSFEDFVISEYRWKLFKKSRPHNFRPRIFFQSWIHVL